MKIARELNAIRGITGLLVFDGESFAQYVEGARQSIEALRLALMADRRHTDLRQLAYLHDIKERAFESWSLGYTDVDAGGLDIDAINQLTGRQALNVFVLATTELDIH
ncbi:BLUF domain-containing protein [Diaphorobacter aerolatus]|uniref:BLUF domain-containing protein n=1 Tax=Diaphorobacter aerolatus TaxID=1288495 RepID=A0A7H0GK74_9BURK|nr:BLUF domain-containing protein [Diaphorobacter aerolatus]QNP48690.1 BLUF domain-containing protein [Diaphorobacter aerolatus]